MDSKYRSFLVPSTANNKMKYSVKFFKESGKYLCDCPYYVIKCYGDMKCKHIERVINYLSNNEEKRG